jgi:tRNA modification GTPase
VTQPNPSQTIFALATAPGRAGIAVLRLSGPLVRDVFAAFGVPVPPPRCAKRAVFRDISTNEILDNGLVLFFPGPASYTGEDVAEFHLHGSRAVISAFIAILGKLPGLKLAGPGEFTRRAFEHGKLDLTEAEAVADLVEAETEAQRRQALRQLSGALGELYEAWRARLLRALAQCEAEIDFPDEGLPEHLSEAIRGEVWTLLREISAHLADNRRGERLRDGISIAIIGPPNAGKSSLLNALAKRDAAITSAIAGTTRDVIEIHLDLAGYPVILADTAGIRDVGDTIEAEGVRRARKRAAEADLVLLVLDITRPEEAAPLAANLIGADTLILANKIDLLPAGGSGPEIYAGRLGPGQALRLSVATGIGMEDLLTRLEGEIAGRFQATGAPLITRARHRTSLEECAVSLRRFASAPLPELAAEDLRLAARALGRITGRVDVEDMLDVIFREFCIGK